MNIVNAMSVDVEDYFHTEAMSSLAPREAWDGFSSHVEANTRGLFEVFAQYDVKATFFFLGWVAERFPKIVREAQDLGHEIGCHSYWHRPVFRLTSQEFWDDTYRARNVLEDVLGRAVIGYRAPNFSINDSVSWAYPILEELGFLYDSSVFPVRHGLYGNHRALRVPYLVCPNLLELPIATWRVLHNNLPVGGGAYLRILPFELMKNGIRTINEKESAPAIIYLHPWEIDESQPRLPASWKSRTRQYIGLSGMKARLERLLQQFAFGRIDDAVYLPAIDRMRKTPPQSLTA